MLYGEPERAQIQGEEEIISWQLDAAVNISI